METQGNEFMNQELALLRKRDKQLINIKAFDIVHHFSTADFINNEIMIKGEVYVLNSIQRKFEPLDFNVALVEHAGKGFYKVNGVEYNANHTFTVNKDTQVAISIIPDAASAVESIVDSKGKIYGPVTGDLTVTVSEALTLTITFKAKV